MRKPDKARAKKPKEEWFESFALEGVDNTRRDYNDNRYIKEGLPHVHKYVREWLTIQLGKPPRKPWTRNDIIAAIAAIVAILAIVISLFVPEVRKWLGLA